MENDAIREALDGLIEEIEWGNWEHLDEDGNEKGHWTVCEVLYSKLDAIKDYIGDDHDKDEMRDTLEQVQSIIEAVGKIYRD